MSFSVELRTIDDLETDDPIREIVLNAYSDKPVAGLVERETFFQFAYGALPPDRTRRVIGELADWDLPVGLYVEEIPKLEEDVFGVQKLFSVSRLAGELSEKYPKVAAIIGWGTGSLDEVSHRYESGEIDDEQWLAAVLIDFARNPLSGYSFVLIRW